MIRPATKMTLRIVLPLMDAFTSPPFCSFADYRFRRMKSEHASLARDVSVFPAESIVIRISIVIVLRRNVRLKNSRRSRKYSLEETRIPSFSERRPQILCPSEWNLPA
jgi:hypothetical protein